MGQSLPHADVVKGFARLAVIEGEEVPGTVFEAFNDRGARALQIFGGIFADIGNIQVARADGKALVCAVAKVKMHGGEFGEPLLPVVSKSRSVQTDLREPFAEAEGARADRCVIVESQPGDFGERIQSSAMSDMKGAKGRAKAITTVPGSGTERLSTFLSDETSHPPLIFSRMRLMLATTSSAVSTSPL